MAIEVDSRGVRNSFSARLTQSRAGLLVAAAVLAVMVAGGVLAPLPGAIALAAIIAATVLIAALFGAVDDAGADVAAPARHEAGKAARDLLSAVVAGLPDAVIVVDRQCIVAAYNARAQAIAPAIAAGQPVSFALRVPDLIDAFRRTAATGEEQRVEFVERIPAERWFAAHVAPVALGGEAAGDLVVATLHDLTPIRRVEEMRADFVANASHELRTPLASLAGFIDTLQGPARDDSQARARFLDIMKAQATRMARLIDDLLSLSRIELKVHLQPQTQVDLVPIVRHVADGLQMLARDRGVEISIDMPASPLTIRGDRDELIRVFENLIENALKYGAAGKRVEVTGRRDDGGSGPEAVIAVRDFGPGIAPEHLPRLTERFYRVDVADSRAQGGTGLGLALVKHILNRHRGRLTIDSTPGQGATFSVKLPLVRAAA